MCTINLQTMISSILDRGFWLIRIYTDYVEVTLSESLLYVRTYICNIADNKYLVAYN